MIVRSQRRAARAAALVILSATAACTKTGAAPDATAAESSPGSAAFRLGVDQALAPLGIAEYLEIAFENRGTSRVELRYARSADLVDQALAGQHDLLLLASEPDLQRLDREGVATRVSTWAHEEVVFIGPGEDPLGTHGSSTPALMLQNISRSTYNFLKPDPRSAEGARYSEIWVKTKDANESNSFTASALEGVELVKKAIALKSFALVRRSALLLAAADGVRPERVYQDGKPDLVLRIRAVEIHPARTKRPRPTELHEFIIGSEGRAIVERFGADRFGYPVYAPGEPPEGEGARVPGLQAQGAPDAPAPKP